MSPSWRRLILCKVWRSKSKVGVGSSAVRSPPAGAKPKLRTGCVRLPVGPPRSLPTSSGPVFVHTRVHPGAIPLVPADHRGDHRSPTFLAFSPTKTTIGFRSRWRDLRRGIYDGVRSTGKRRNRGIPWDARRDILVERAFRVSSWRFESSEVTSAASNSDSLN